MSVTCPSCGREDDGTSYQCPNCYAVLQGQLAEPKKPKPSYRPPAKPTRPPPGGPQSGAPPGQPGGYPPPGGQPGGYPPPPGGGGYPPPPGQSPYAPPGSPYGYPEQPRRPTGFGDPPTYMVQSILVTIFCCLPLGIAAIVNAAKVSSLMSGGQYYEAEAASNRAKQWCVWGAVGGVVVTIFWVLLQLNLRGGG